MHSTCYFDGMNRDGFYEGGPIVVSIDKLIIYDDATDSVSSILSMFLMTPPSSSNSKEETNPSLNGFTLSLITYGYSFVQIPIFLDISFSGLLRFDK